MLELVTGPSTYSPEALGKARAFRNRVLAENDAYLQASQQMIAPLYTRIKRFPLRNFRIDKLRGFEAAWRQGMPQEFSIDLVSEWPKHGLVVSELRLSCADFRDDGWDPAYQESEVSVAKVTVTLGRKIATVQFRILAIVSLRALAQRIRWGWASDDGSLIRDLVVLSEFDASAIPEGAYFTVPVGDAAGWRARAIDAEIDGRTQRVIACRDWWA